MKQQGQEKMTKFAPPVAGSTKTPATGGKQQAKISAFFTPKPGATPAAGKTPSSAGATPAARQTPAAPAAQPAAATHGKNAVADAQAVSSNGQAPELLVGRRIQVWWADDNRFYAGNIKQFEPSNGKHHVVYDDGDQDWYVLSEEKYELLPEGGPGTQQQRTSPRSAAKRQGPAAAAAATGATTAAAGGGVEDLEDADVEMADAGAAGSKQPAAASGCKPKTGGSKLTKGAAPAGGSQAKAAAAAGKSSGGGGGKKASGAAARKGKVIMSDDDEQEEEEEAEEESGSEYQGESEDEESEGAYDGDASEADSEGADEDEGSEGSGKKKKGKKPSKKEVGTKRKRPADKAAAPRKRAPAAAAAAAAAPTPAAPAEAPTSKHATGNAGAAVSVQRASSAGAGAAHPPPPAGARKKLHNALDVAPPPVKKEGVTDVVHGVETRLSSEDAGRFLARMVERFPFLHPNNIRDAQKRRPDHPEYDRSTLHIPPNWFKEAKVSPGQQQWWTFKAANFDAVILFKMGKFYEMLEMDSYVGVDVLGLQFMKGDQPHAGFPEVRYHDMAEALARAGYKVVVVEQTETPEGLARRNEERKRAGQKMQNVVNREKVAVLSKGTLIDAEMVQSKPDPSYVMAVYEMPPLPSVQASDNTLVTRIGVVAADVASGLVLVGEFPDDEVRSTLRTHLTALQPVELVLPPKAAPASGVPSGLDPTTARVLRTSLRDPRVNTSAKPGGWTAERALRTIAERRYFSASASQEQQEGKAATPAAGESGQGFTTWPRALRAAALAYAARTSTSSDQQQQAPNGDVDMSEAQQGSGASASGGEGGAASALLDGEAALAALCGMLDFLRDALLDRAVMPLGRVDALPALFRAPKSGSPSSSPGLKSEAQGPSIPRGSDEPTYMLLNGAALENLEVLENTEGGASGTLLAALDHCTTPFGRRRLRQWLCRPLYRKADIERRQDAVAVLMGPATEAAGRARKHMSGISDLERAVARLHASTVSGAEGRDAHNVVLYEDAKKRRVRALTSAIRDLKAVVKAAEEFRGACGDEAEDEAPTSTLLASLTSEDRWARVGAALDSISGAADWKEAEATGRVIPAEGVDEAYDSALAQMSEAEETLAEYLKEVRAQVKGSPRDVVFVSNNKESHVIEVPDSIKVPRDFTMVGQRKGFKKYDSADLKALRDGLAKAVEVKEAALGAILQGLVRRFCGDRELWGWAVDSVAELDALMSLASHALNADGAVCRPRIVDASEPGGTPVLEARMLRHPAGIPGRMGTFVPNDIALGGAQHPAFIVLTGPNMGGKSTLLRQACLAALLAQVGACVPAESLALTPVDAIFVRMGAKDHIMTGQSTFFVELAETAAMLQKATSRSLVALDELGRGTATLDGAAIASAVLSHMAHTVGCRGLFATHYHHLASEHACDPAVSIMHMACAVGGQEEAEVDGTAGTTEVEEVTFLYKLAPGACPKSYGTNVARLAGLPGAVVSRAAAISARTHSDSRAAAHLTSVPHTLRGAVTHAAKYLQEVLGPQEGGAEHQPAALAVRGLLGVQRSVSKLLQSAAV